MPRRRGAENREVVADAVYSSTLVEKFVCSMMWDGKKSTAQKIFYASMQKLEERGGGEEAIKLFKKASPFSTRVRRKAIVIRPLDSSISLRIALRGASMS